MRTILITALLSTSVAAQATPEEATAAPDSTTVVSEPQRTRALVHAAVLDYVEGLYEVAPKRVERSVDPALAKFGFSARGDKPYTGSAMSHSELVALAGSWNTKGKLPKDAPKKIEILDILPRIACAKLTAQWGTDYFHLTKCDDGQWRIRHVIWQSPQRATSEQDQAAARAAIEAAAGLYLDAFYFGEPDKLKQSLHPDLAKFGYYQGPDGMAGMSLTFAAAAGLATTVANQFPDDSLREIALIDVQDQTAIIKLTAAWGVDYMNFAKFEDGWRAMHVVWQSHPETQTTMPAGADKMDKAVNAKCPFSGKPVRADSLATYHGTVVGFCNPDCRDKFVCTPARFVEQIPELGY